MQITAQSILFALGFLGLILADVAPVPGVPSDPAVPNVPDVASLAQNQPSSTLSTNGKSKKPKHSECYNYFLQKDGCVFSAKKKSERCHAGSDDDHCGHEVPADIPVVFKGHAKHTTQTLLGVDVTPGGIHAYAGKTEEDEASGELLGPDPSKRLVRRYDSELDSFTISGGEGICGTYRDDQPGVCLWASAANVEGSLSGGWMNGTYTKACGRQVYIQRKGDPGSVVFAQVVDGCNFNAFTPHEEDPACFRIGFTKATFQALNPTPEEAKSMIMKNLIWNFDNEQGTKPENAAV